MRERATKLRQVLLVAILVALGIPASGADLNDMELLEVRRVHVEQLSGDITADQIRDMIISELNRTGLWVLTEDPERADAILRGSAEDLVYEEVHDYSDGLDARTSLSLGRAAGNSNSRSFAGNTSVGEDQSGRSVQRRHEALAAVRLINRQGDVIWSTVQESQGAKFRSASADVAMKVTEQLVRDVEGVEEDEAPGEADPFSASLPTAAGSHER